MERLAEEITEHLKIRFGYTVHDAMSIDKGWLNVKWKMETDRGPVFVKYYHPERYKLHMHPDRRSAIERTLQLQQGLSQAGIPCPGVHSYIGRFIQETPSGIMYALLDWVDGFTVPAGRMNAAQMLDMGKATGRMHKWLQAEPLLSKPAWIPDKDAYMRDWRINWGKAQEAGDELALGWLKRSQAIVGAMDFRMFDSSPIGWLHWDLWVDNIVLHESGVAGIVDFDRMTMAYPEIDVARAVLSGALREGQMQVENVRAFMEGYREHFAAPNGMLSRALCMLYLIESNWWLRTEIRAESELRGLLGRFVEEMHWIEDQWERDNTFGLMI